jgi:hypothetical protein
MELLCKIPHSCHDHQKFVLNFAGLGCTTGIRGEKVNLNFKVKGFLDHFKVGSANGDFYII